MRFHWHRRPSALVGSAVLAGVMLSAAPANGQPAAASPPAENQPHPASRLEPGHWLEAPDSHLRKVAFDWPEGITYRQNALGVAGVVAAWCGGDYDTKRDRLIVWGGGHRAYAGNEIYAFDVQRLRWERVNDPSLAVDEGRSETYTDGSPRSCHTYDFIEYVPAIDRFCSFGIKATYPSGVGGGNTVWAFDFDRKAWETKTKFNERRGDAGCPSGSALDPVTGHVFVVMRNGSLNEWDPVADEWTERTSGGGNGYKAIGVLDPLGRAFYSIGGDRLTRFDVSTSDATPRQEIPPEGPTKVVEGYAPGLEYDPVLDKIVGWDGGADLFLMDPQSMKWERTEPAAGNTVTPTDAVRAGTYGRFRYVPSLNAYVVVNGVDENVYMYRLTNRAEKPVPARFAAVLESSGDLPLIDWVAGQVARWPGAKSAPVLNAALEAQQKAGRAEIAKLLEDHLQKSADGSE